MKYNILALALGVVWSSQVLAGEVYVAPGGVYIASANVHVGTGNGYPTYGAPGRAYYAPYDAPPAYAPGYVPPGQVYRSPAYYDGYRSAYPARPTYIDQSYIYAEGLPPRPPAAVPYGNGARCGFDPVYGRSEYCD